MVDGGQRTADGGWRTANGKAVRLYSLAVCMVHSRPFRRGGRQRGTTTARATINGGVSERRSGMMDDEDNDDNNDQVPTLLLLPRLSCHCCLLVGVVGGGGCVRRLLVWGTVSGVCRHKILGQGSFCVVPTRMSGQHWQHFDTSPTCHRHVANIPS
jgi:hypothetical protein